MITAAAWILAGFLSNKVKEDEMPAWYLILVALLAFDYVTIGML